MCNATADLLLLLFMIHVHLSNHFYLFSCPVKVYMLLIKGWLTCEEDCL